jgi:hypothetical protein
MMRVTEFNAARLVIEDSGTGWGVVCVIAGHAVAIMPLAWPTWYWWTTAIEVLIGAVIAAYGAVLLTKTRTVFNRVAGALTYERRNFFGLRTVEARFNEVEDVLMQRGAREPVPAGQDAAFEENYPYRIALRVRGEVVALGRTYREYKQAAQGAALIRGVLEEWAQDVRPA